MKATQKASSAVGRRIVARETETRRLAVDFPGWGHPDCSKFIEDIPVGLAGEIIDVESHGSNPWTRYGVRFDDGTRANGLVLGKDIQLT